MKQVRTVVVVDTETTGLGHADHYQIRRDGVVQVGYSWRNPDGKVESWHKTCNPGAEFVAGGRARRAFEVNGLSERKVLASPPAKKVAAEVAKRFEKITSETGLGLELRAYNRDFDEPFLRPKPWELHRHRWGPCIMKAAARHFGGTGGRWLKLGAAVDRLGLDWPGPGMHNAAADSHAAPLVDEVVSGRRPRG